jgi:hypothetical protein
MNHDGNNNVNSDSVERLDRETLIRRLRDTERDAAIARVVEANKWSPPPRKCRWGIRLYKPVAVRDKTDGTVREGFTAMTHLGAAEVLYEVLSEPSVWLTFSTGGLQRFYTAESAQILIEQNLARTGDWRPERIPFVLAWLDTLGTALRRLFSGKVSG